MAKFDLTETQEVHDLFNVGREQRDQTWRDRFFAAIVDASMATTPQQILRGPDRFPYFVLNLPPAGEPFETFCISHILDACLDHGFGAVIQPEPDPPQWVFTYGNLWSLKEFGKFELEQLAEEGAGESNGVASAKPPPSDAGDPRPVLTGQPSASFLPPYARKAIKEFLTEKTGNAGPRVLLVNDPRNTAGQLLTFSVFAEDFASKNDFEDVMYRLTWYLPPHYGLVSIAKDSELAKGFEPL